MMPEAPKNMIQYWGQGSKKNDSRFDPEISDHLSNPDFGGSDCAISHAAISEALHVDATAHSAITGPIEFLNVWGLKT